MIIKEQNYSYHSSLLIGPNGSFFCTQKNVVVLTFKIVFFIKQWLFEFATFFLIRPACGLVSAKKECFFLLFLCWTKVNFFAVLCDMLWFFGFKATRFYNFFVFTFWPLFHVFFLALSLYHIIDSSQIKLLAIKTRHNWAYKSLDKHRLWFQRLRHPFLEEFNRSLLQLSLTVVLICLCSRIKLAG